MRHDAPTVVPAWVTATTPRVDVVVGSRPDEVERLSVAFGGGAGSEQRDRVAILQSRPAPDGGRRQALVLIDDTVVGRLPDRLGAAYVRVLAPIQRAGHAVSVPAHARFPADRAEGQRVADVWLDLPAPQLLVAANVSPKGRLLDLPSGGPLRLVGTVGRHHELLGTPVPRGGILVHVSLRRAHPPTGEARAHDVEVRLDTRTIGSLPPEDVAAYLELLTVADERGVTVAAHAVVGSELHHRIELWAPRGADLGELMDAAPWDDAAVSPPEAEMERRAAARRGDQTTAAPSVTAPTVTAPALTAPGVAAPAVAAPTLEAPALEAPALTPPTVDTRSASPTRRTRVRSRRASGSGAPATVGDPAPPEEEVDAPAPTPRPHAGWYADPADRGRSRFWDGVTWTHHVMQSGSGADQHSADRLRHGA